ncbi:MAG: adenylate/guanylate cyclase domain-containing protein [Acidimicrobiales bacterium]
MPACAACGSENPAAFRFCGVCGSPLADQVCSSCGFALVPGHRFCGRCGTPHGEARARSGLAVEGADERKLATVLFADVEGFTAMAEAGDPETVARIVDAAFRRMAEVVLDHGGTVDKYLGDCLMAVFGVPTAHDDDAERAVAAGLAMRELAADLAFSIGINTGEVMVTAVGRDGEVTVIGDAVNVAARLEKAAAPGEVLVGRLTAELSGARVLLRPRPPVMLKGKRDPVEVWAALGMREDHQPGSGELGAVEPPPLVGRGDEIEFLEARWRRTVRDGVASVVLLCGDAGLGKTRLADELCATAVATATASPTGRTAADGDGDGQRGVHVVRATYPAYGGMGGPRVAAQILRALGPTGEVEIDARARSVAGDLHPSLRSIDPGAIEKEQLWAFRRLVEIKAAEAPILLVIDDIHRCSDRTLELLSDLIRLVADSPVLLVLVGRPEPGGWLAHFPSATTVRLDPLASTDATVLAQALVTEGCLAPAAADALVLRAGGNPLHLRELVAMVRSRGGLVPAAEEGRWELAGDLSLPPSLHAILAARLDALAPAEKQCVQMVAVLGDSASAAQLEALGVADGARTMHALYAAGLLRGAMGAEGVEGCEVADPLLREVAYETLPRHVRGELHRRAAEVTGSGLERARHLERAAGYLPEDSELAARAAEALARLGTELLGARRRLDGIQLLLRAVGLGWRDPRSMLTLVGALIDVTRSEEALAILDLIPASDDPVLAAEVVHSRGAALIFSDPAASMSLLEEARRRWATLGDAVKEGWARANRGVALFFLGRSEESGVELLAALDNFGSAAERPGELSVYRFFSLVRPDDPRAVGWLEESLAHAESVGDRTGQLNSLDSLAWNHFLRCRLGAGPSVSVAHGYVERFLALAEEMDMPVFLGHALCIASNQARLGGDLDSALRHARRAEGMPEAWGPLGTLAHALGWSARTAAGGEPGAPEEPVPDLGDSPDPLHLLAQVVIAEELVFAGRFDEARSVATRLGRRASLQRLEGLIGGFLEALFSLLTGDLDGAARAAREALESAEIMDAPPAAAAARAVLAEVALRAGDPGAARRWLADLADPADPAAPGRPVPGGVAGALVVRARALLGEEGAAEELAASAAALRMPGLLADLAI